MASPASSPVPAALAAGPNAANTPAPIIEPSPMITASPVPSRRARVPADPLTGPLPPGADGRLPAERRGLAERPRISRMTPSNQDRRLASFARSPWMGVPGPAGPGSERGLGELHQVQAGPLGDLPLRRGRRARD